MPKSWAGHQKEASIAQARVWMAPGFDTMLQRSGGFLHTDGAGEGRNVPAAPRVVAAGGAVMEGSFSSSGIEVTSTEGFAAEVPGRQTIPRAELWAVVLGITRSDPHDHLDIGVDAAYVTRGWLSTRQRLCAGLNGRLCSLLFSLVENLIF